MFIPPSLAVNRLGPEAESPQAIMPKQFNDLLSKVRKSGFVPRPNSPSSPRRDNASHASREGRSPAFRSKSAKQRFPVLTLIHSFRIFFMQTGIHFA
jgi:hypothetical protein